MAGSSLVANRRLAGMDQEPTPKDLRGAAAVAQTMAYVSGLAGIVAGALIYRSGDVALAVVIWVLTFAAGALMMVAAFLTRGLAALMARMASVQTDLQVLLRDRAADRSLDPPRPHDPW